MDDNMNLEYIHGDLPKEAFAIHKCFPTQSAQTIIDYVIKYQDHPCEERKRLVIQKLLEDWEKDDKKNLTIEANNIIGIYPQYSFEEIYEKLASYDITYNRVYYVLKDLTKTKVDEIPSIQSPDCSDTEEPYRETTMQSPPDNSDIDEANNLKESNKRTKRKSDFGDVSATNSKLPCLLLERNETDVWGIRNRKSDELSLSTVSLDSTDSIVIDKNFKKKNVNFDMNLSSNDIFMFEDSTDSIAIDKTIKNKSVNFDINSNSGDLIINEISEHTENNPNKKLKSVLNPSILDRPSTSSDTSINLPIHVTSNFKVELQNIKPNGIYFMKIKEEPNNNKEEKYNLIKTVCKKFPDVSETVVKGVCGKYTQDIYTPPMPENLNNILHEVSEINLDIQNSNLIRELESDVIGYMVENKKINEAIDLTKKEDLMLRTRNGMSANDMSVIEINDTLYEDAFMESMDGEDEAIALKDIPNEKDVDKQLLYHIMEMFPEADPTFLRTLCKNKKNRPEYVDQIITSLFEMENYPKRSQRPPSPEVAINAEEQLEIMKQVLPDADPTYLMRSLDELKTQDELKLFISNALENQNYPTMKEYLRKQQLSSQTKQYTTEFKVEKFLELIPDPKTYFNAAERKAIKPTKSSHDYYYCIAFLKNRYTKIGVAFIRATFTRCNDNIIQTCNVLDTTTEGQINSRRKYMDYQGELQNIPLLQAMAYLTHKDEIDEVIKTMHKAQEIERKDCKAAGLMQTCSCCYDDEVMPKDVVECFAGCGFCKSCLEKSVEIAFGEGKLDFPCLADCGQKFTLQALKAALNAKLFSKVAQKKQLEEVKAAGIEELETCPFCDFATIPAPADKVFKCLNSECMKESCRECKEPSHVPLRCDEIEKDVDVKNRVYIENKMTEALLRKCYKCGMKFIKADGCNKMTCSCGAKMCYVCKQPVEDYKHFNGQGGDRLDLCPLYSDTHLLHQTAVQKSAEAAKAEINVDLKIDPADGLMNHYDEMRKKAPVVIPPGMNVAGHPPHLLEVIPGLVRQRLEQDYIGHIRQVHHRQRQQEFRHQIRQDQRAQEIALHMMRQAAEELEPQYPDGHYH